MTCGARLPMRPSLPRPKPTASAVRQNPSREVCPFTFCLFNQSRTLGRHGALATPLQSITSALFPMQRRGRPFPLHSPCVFSNFHTPTASLCFSRTLEGSTSTKSLRTAASPDFVGAPLRYLFPFFSRVGDCGYESPASPVPAFFSPLFNFKPSIGIPDPIGTVNLFLCPLV